VWVCVCVYVPPGVRGNALYKTRYKNPAPRSSRSSARVQRESTFSECRADLFFPNRRRVQHVGGTRILRTRYTYIYICIPFAFVSSRDVFRVLTSTVGILVSQNRTSRGTGTAAILRWTSSSPAVRTDLLHTARDKNTKITRAKWRIIRACCGMVIFLAKKIVFWKNV